MLTPSRSPTVPCYLLSTSGNTRRGRSRLVVLVLEAKPLAGLRQNLADFIGRGVLVLHVLEVLLHQVGVAVKLLADLEVVQMAVRPAHRRLDVFVQRVERAVLHLDSPPDRGDGFLGA